MDVRAITKSVKISAFKAREVTREIQGMPVLQALDVVRFSPKKAARFIDKTLRTAIANAENNNRLKVQNLVIKEAVVGEGPTMKRSQPKARGSAGPIRKRTSHIRIILTEREAEPKNGATKSTRAEKKARQPEEKK
jgi:large subunit ribosomal protein L22